MTYDRLPVAVRPLPSIDAVLAAHGARKVLAAAIAAMLRGTFRKTRPPDLPMTGHMRRDIGLPEPAERIWPGL